MPWMILARENLIITPDEMKGIMKHQSLEANTFVPQIFFGMTVKLYASASHLNRHENCAKLILEVTERLNAHMKQNFSRWIAVRDGWGGPV